MIPIISNSNVLQYAHTGILHVNGCNTERTASWLQTFIRHLQVYFNTNWTQAQSVFFLKKYVSEGMWLWQVAGMEEVDGSMRLRSPDSCGTNTLAGTSFEGVRLCGRRGWGTPPHEHAIQAGVAGPVTPPWYLWLLPSIDAMGTFSHCWLQQLKKLRLGTTGLNSQRQMFQQPPKWFLHRDQRRGRRGKRKH